MLKNKNEELVSPSSRIDGPFISKISLHEVNTLITDLEGKILTVIDASMTEQKQREAVKSLLKQYIWGDFDKVRDWYYNQKDGMSSSFPFRGNASEPVI